MRRSDSFSFSIGTARHVRMPPSSTAATICGSRSYVSRIGSHIGDVNYLFGRDHATERMAFGFGRNGARLRLSAKAGGVLCAATKRRTSPSQR